GLIWAIGDKLVLVPVILIMTLSLVGFTIGARLRGALRERAAHDDHRYSFILEVLGRIPIVKSMAMEPLMQRRYERLQATQAGTSYHAAFISGIAQGSSALFASIAIVSVVATGALMVGPGGLTLGELSACTLLTGRAMQPILRALSLWTQFQSLSVAQDQLKTTLDLSLATAKVYRPIPKLAGRLELRNLTFGYDPESDPVLQDVSFSISAGEIIAIKGEKGSGRTTLLGLMSGLLTPTAGKIFLDGEDITEFDPVSLRQQISIVPTQPVLFQGTVLENLTMFRAEIHFNDVLKITKQLGLDDIIGGLQSGYDTRVGDGSGNDLPIGIAQLLIIARSLISQPRVLLFNEANSRLDQGADAQLHDALACLRGHTTIILISHRPSFVALADRVLTLSNGKVQFSDTSSPARNVTPIKQTAPATPTRQSA
ncbi:MAG: peptidase domain-containing ABC transporter, partial [Alphaproteobacteria bacterium]